MPTTRALGTEGFTGSAPGLGLTGMRVVIGAFGFTIEHGAVAGVESRPALVREAVEGSLRRLATRRNDPRFQGANLDATGQAAAAVRELAVRALAVRTGATAGPLALAWRLHEGDDIAPTPGTTGRPYLEANVAAARGRRTPDERATLDAALAPAQIAGRATASSRGRRGTGDVGEDDRPPGHAARARDHAGIRLRRDSGWRAARREATNARSAGEAWRRCG